MANKMHYVYSTLATDMKYVEWQEAPKGAKDYIPTEKASVVIKGGAGVVTKNLITPMGVATAVSDEEMAILQQSSVFKAHERNGYIRIESKRMDPEKAASDMEGRDESAQAVEADFKKGGRFAAQQTGAPKSGPVGQDDEDGE